ISPAFAHAQLVNEAPKAQSSGPAPTMLTLHFSEDVNAKFSKIALTMGTKPVALSVATDPKDNKALIATPAQALGPGIDTVNWTSVAADDAHKLTGSYSFTVQ